MKTVAQKKQRPRLSLNPQQVSAEFWYYEERKGINLYGGDKGMIPWRMLEASLKRYRAVQRAKKSKQKRKKK